MHTSPQLHCANVLDTLRVSGLIYTLKETPYSAYLTLRKRFTKEFLSSTDLSHTHAPTLVHTPAHAPPHAPAHTSSHTPPQLEPHHIQLLQTNTYLKQALELELANHANTKYQLSVRETGFLKLSNQNEHKINDTFNEHYKLATSVSILTHDLAKETHTVRTCPQKYGR